MVHRSFTSQNTPARIWNCIHVFTVFPLMEGQYNRRNSTPSISFFFLPSIKLLNSTSTCGASSLLLLLCKLFTMEVVGFSHLLYSLFTMFIAFIMRCSCFTTTTRRLCAWDIIMQTVNCFDCIRTPLREFCIHSWTLHGEFVTCQPPLSILYL